MTVEEVEEIVRLQSSKDLILTNDHRITLEQALVKPRRIAIIIRDVKNGRVVKDQVQDVWLVGQENAVEGYRIVMRERDASLASLLPVSQTTNT